MKKGLIAVFALLMLVCFASCGEATVTETSDTAESTTAHTHIYDQMQTSAAYLKTAIGY